MEVKDMTKSKELYIYYEGFKTPSLYGIIKEDGEKLMVLDEDGVTIITGTIKEILKYDSRLMMEEDKIERYVITEAKL